MTIQILDRRTQKTKNLLWESFVNLVLEKGYDSVTIQDIITRANIGRSTFYSHYESKENLLLSGQVHLFGNSFNDNENVSFPNFQNLLLHAKQNIELTKAMLKIDNSSKFTEHIHNFILDKLNFFTLGEIKINSDYNNLKYTLLVNSVASAIVSIIIDWIKNDVKIPQFEIEELINNIINCLLVSG